MAMYKNRNTRTGNGMRGTWGMWGMFYFGECRQIFWGMSSNIPGNVPKHSGEYRKTFRGMSSNILGNVSLSHCFYKLVLWQQGKYIWHLEESNQGLCSENSPPQRLCFSELVGCPNTLL